ncbi:MAG TPA: alpha/beta fold hydrolase [Caulobacteraceae bacterium]|nr:alpha/beta fold hydrolase [Caulobacteraceae bacterium]
MRVLASALLLMFAAACAPMQVQHALAPGPDFTGPRLEADRFVSFDGAKLGLTRWLPAGGEPWAVIVGVHGMDDYARTFHLAAPDWAAHGIATYAYDQRGFGRSPERRIWAGDALMTEDLRTIVALVRQRYPHAIIAVAGESLGGAVAIEAFASDQPPDADRLVLLAPAVWGWSSQPLLYKLALVLAAHLAPDTVLRPPRALTAHIAASDNTQELIAMGRDPLMIWGARLDTLYGLVGIMQHADDDIGKLRVPTLYLMGAKDEIIPRAPAQDAAHRLPAGDRTAYYAQGWHLLLRDKQARNVWADVAAFVRDPTAPLPSGAPPIPGAASSDAKPAGGATSRGP